MSFERRDSGNASPEDIDMLIDDVRTLMSQAEILRANVEALVKSQKKESVTDVVMREMIVMTDKQEAAESMLEKKPSIVALRRAKTDLQSAIDEVRRVFIEIQAQSENAPV